MTLYLRHHHQFGENYREDINREIGETTEPCCEPVYDGYGRWRVFAGDCIREVEHTGLCAAHRFE